MMTLTVALPLVRPTVGTEFSYALSDDGQEALDHGIAPLALLPGADALVLVVPARALSWHEVKLPPMASSRLRAALDGVLEDRLLDEPANLAFAVGPDRGPDGTVMVAVCDKPWLRAVLEFFELAKRPAARVVPEFAPVNGAAAPRCVAVTGTVEDAWLALMDSRGVLCAPLGAAPVLLDPGAGESDAVTLLAEPAVAALAEQALAHPVAIQPAAQGLLASTQTDWELAQFDLAISSGGRIARRWAQGSRQFMRVPAWRAARWGFVTLLVANLAGLNAWAWRQDAALQAKRDQVKGLLVQTFPKVKAIVDAPLQMERELGLLRQGSGALSGRDLEVMLGAVGAVLPDGSTPTAIDFVPGQAGVKGLGLNASQVALVTGKLAGLGYVARLDGERLVVRAGDRP